MFKWPVPPSPHAPANEIADFAELVCWRDGSTSYNAIRSDLGRLDENDYSGGVPEEDKVDSVVDGAYREVEQRRVACRGGYPFKITSPGYTLKLIGDNVNHRGIVYLYLLLATRLNMKNSRLHSGIDGSLLLEHVAADTACEYFGARAESMVFGHDSSGVGFADRINNLCSRLQEGAGFHGGATPTANDGKLDIAAWTHFTDGLPGKLIAFGQCKTGTHYRDTLTQLQPDSFCNKWLRSSPAISPLRMFFVAEALSRVRWYETASDAGLLFDRCRIVDFCDQVQDDVLERVARWTGAAAGSAGLAPPLMGRGRRGRR